VACKKQNLWFSFGYWNFLTPLGIIMTQYASNAPYCEDTEPVAISGFEGPEKRLEIDFKHNVSSLLGLRALSADKWQEMLNYAKCIIISHAQNEYFDAYVLSESSLFVYPFKIMIKTCGTTTLLNCIPKLLEFAGSLDLQVEFVMFSRKNYLFPSKQKGPHCVWDSEVKYLDSIFDGTAYTIGPSSSDRWFLYLADYSDNTRIVMPEKTLEIMMHKLDTDVAAQFYRKEETCDKDKFPGVADFLPESETDEFNFSPCGYSMNGLKKEAYYTIHVTPETHCSYASFETNISLPSYSSLINHVVSFFKPGKMTIMFFAEKPTAAARIDPFDLELPGYVIKHKNLSELEGNCDITMVNYEAVEISDVPKAPRKVKLPVVPSLAY